MLEGKRIEVVLTPVEMQKLHKLKQLIAEHEGFKLSISQVIAEAIRALLNDMTR